MQINMLGYFVDYYYLFFSFSIGDKRFLNSALWEFAYLKFDHKIEIRTIYNWSLTCTFVLL